MRRRVIPFNQGGAHGIDIDFSDYWADKHQADKERQSFALNSMQAQLDKLTLVNYALWTLLQEKYQLTDAELAARINMFDAKDGTVNGKLRGDAHDCPQCKRVIAANHFRCQYCGFTLPDEEGFSLFLGGPVQPSNK